MKRPDLYDLSDQLKAMKRRFSDFESGGVTLGGKQVRHLCTELAALAKLALAREMEISRHCWNEAARRDAETVLAEAQRPGTNLLLLPAQERRFGE